MPFAFRLIAVVCTVLALLSKTGNQSLAANVPITRATLPNGLRVIVVRDPAGAGGHRHAQLPGRS